jgi:valyl-tRNA synthetase
MELPKHYDAHASEKKWMLYWEKEGIYKFDPKSKAEIYSVDTPPPTVSGKMHIGHAFSFSQQDFIVRFHRMLGKNVFCPFGTDDNGLPTERLVEKMKNVKGQFMERKEFVKLCLETLKEIRPRYVQDWKSIGMSCDWDIFYTTINEHCQRTSQRSFLELHKMGRIYRKYAPVMVCPNCATAIAQVELEDVQRNSKLYHIKVEVDGKDSLTFATTRPELMMACIAISVHPDDKRYKEFIGKKAVIPVSDVKVPIVAESMTKMEFGSGVVYWCPFGDSSDIEFVAKHPELRVKHIMNRDGKLNESAGKYKGMKSIEAREAVVKDWKESGALVKEEEIQQVVNAHERCGTVIEFVAMDQWFIRYLDLKKEFIKYGRKIKWHPDHMRARYENWIDGLKWDWNISRQRHFGVPIPVWYCRKCSEITVADKKQLPVDPLVDKPLSKCKCGSDDFILEKDVLDTWATSSLTPDIAIELMDKKVQKNLFPMSLRPQAHDIITFWLFNTVVKSYFHHKDIPWKNAMISGWALDPKGKKMSKSKGNIIEPQDVLKKYSADCLRFWAGGSRLGDDLAYQEKHFVTGNKFVTKIWNASKFAIMHLEDYKQDKPKKIEIMDKWILSKTSKLIKECTANFMNYEYSHTKLAADTFFWHTFCDNYLEIVKDRIYNVDKRGKESRLSAQYGLYNSLLTVLKLMAPITPFITEELYQLFYKKHEKVKSIHISKWPDLNFIDEGAEKAGDFFVYVLQHVRRAKSEKNMSLKKPAKKVIAKGKISKEDFEKIKADLLATTYAEELVFEALPKSSKIDYEVVVDI